MTSTQKKWPNRIAELRKAHGLTQSQLGALIGLDKTMVSRLERGEIQLKLDLAKKVSEVLDVTIQELLSMEEFRSFSEDAEPYRSAPSDPLLRLADPARNLSLYRVKSNALDELGIHSGYVVLIDISAEAVEKVKPLTPVIAQIYSRDTLTEAVTVVRQFVPPNLLITNSKSENRPPINMTAEDAHIKGVILSWHRAFSG